MKTVFFPGSFNPFTKGHADIVARMLGFVGKVVIGIGINSDKENDADNITSRLEAIRKLYREEVASGCIEVISYTGLTAEKAIEIGADFMVRGVRGCTDFEYEYNLAAANRKAFGIETLLLPGDPTLSFISSSLLRDLKRNNREDIAEEWLP